MSYKIDNIDRTTIATAMLPMVKQQVRVLSNTDDIFLTGLIIRTIDIFQRASGMTIFKTDVTWMPDEFDTVTRSGVVVPVQPLIDWTAEDGSGVDVTGNYIIVGSAAGQGGHQFLRRYDSAGSITSAFTTVIITAVAGSETVDDISPAALQAILNRVATLYAWREDVADSTIQAMPESDQQWMVGNWIPRA